MPPPLAEMCKTAREKMCLSQSKFAKLIGTNQTEISFIERGFIPENKEKIKNIKRIYEETKNGIENHQQTGTR